MSAKGTLLEADPSRRTGRNAQWANLAQVALGWTSRHPLQIIIAFVFLTAVSGVYAVRHFFHQHRRQRLDFGRSSLAAAGTGL